MVKRTDTAVTRLLMVANIPVSGLTAKRAAGALLRPPWVTNM